MSAQEAKMRLAMTLYVSEGMGSGPQQPDRHEFFRQGLEHFDVRAVCLRISRRADQSRAILRAAGFQKGEHSETYEIWVRGVGVPHDARTG